MMAKVGHWPAVFACVACLLLFAEGYWTQATWTLGAGENALNELAQYGYDKPGSREGVFSAITTDSSGERFLRMFGGHGASWWEEQGYLNDIWEWDVGRKAWDWKYEQDTNLLNQRAIYGPLGNFTTYGWPGSRAGGAGWADEEGNMWIYGGVGYAQSSDVDGYLSDIWQWNETSKQWAWMAGSRNVNERLTLSPANETSPGGREAFAYTVDDNGNLFIFGGIGYDNTGSLVYHNDLWFFNTTSLTWTNTHAGFFLAVWGTQGVSSPLNCPPKLVLSAMAFHQRKLYLFGGLGRDTMDFDMDYLQNAMWVFDLDTSEWTWTSGHHNREMPGVYTTGSGSTRDLQQSTQDYNIQIENSGNFGEISQISGNFKKPRSLLYFESKTEKREDMESTESMESTEEQNQWDAMAEPDGVPIAEPVAEPVAAPQSTPVEAPVAVPIAVPVAEPVAAPVAAPVAEPILEPVSAPSTAPESAPVATPIEAPVSQPIAVPEAVPQAAPQSAPETLSPPTPVAPPVPAYPGSRAGHAMMLNPWDGLIYMVMGVGNDGANVTGNLNDLWAFDPNTAEWTWVSGNTSVYASPKYATPGIPGGRYNPGMWIDDFSNVWVGMGFYYLSYTTDQFRNDIWAYSLVAPPAPGAPIFQEPMNPPVTPIPRPPQSPTPTFASPLAVHEPTQPELCGPSPGGSWVCIGYQRWAYPNDFLVPEGFIVPADTVCMVYGDLNLPSNKDMTFEPGSAMYISGRADLFGTLTLQLSKEVIDEMKKVDEDSSRRKVMLISHHEIPPAKRDDDFDGMTQDVKEGKKLAVGPFVERSAKSSNTAVRQVLAHKMKDNVANVQQAKRAEEVANEGEKRPLKKRAVNEGVKQGKGKVIGSKCASFSYDLDDEFISGDTYYLYADIENISTSCAGLWWVALLIVLAVLVVVLVTTLCVLQYGFKRSIWNGFARMDDPNAAPAPVTNDFDTAAAASAARRPARHTGAAVIDISEISINSDDDVDDDEDEESGEEVDDEEDTVYPPIQESEMEGSEEPSESEEEYSEEASEEEDDDDLEESSQ